MVLHEIKKQKLLAEPLSADSLKLARAIYNTFMELGDDSILEIKVNTIQKLLNLQQNEDGKQYIIKTLEDINEPLVVKNFKFYATVYPMRFLKFCEYKINGDMIEIDISEEFLLAEKEYMLDNFLTA